MKIAHCSSNVYLEALAISNRLDLEQKVASTQQRIYARAKVLEIAAMASRVFSLVQFTKVRTPFLRRLFYR